MSYVPVPKDLTQVKTKVALNLTKRQLIFFSLAGVTGIPLYFLLKKPLTSGVAAIIMVTVMLPFFFMAMYEKDGLPFEKVMGYIIRQKFRYPAVRPYKTENFYAALDVTIEAQILRLIKNLCDTTGMSCLLISHNLGVIAQMCDYVYVMYAGKVVEQGDVFTIFERPEHPYTKGLLSSVIRLDELPERLSTIPGMVPNLMHLPEGCAFCGRCQNSSGSCKKEKPDLYEVATDHKVRCFSAKEREAAHE